MTHKKILAVTKLPFSCSVDEQSAPTRKGHHSSVLEHMSCRQKISRYEKVTACKACALGKTLEICF